jgi:BolA protein
MGRSSVSTEAKIRAVLMNALRPTRLDVINESALHAGHRSSPGTGESHFRVLIVSEHFLGKSRIVRHRMVNEAVASELRSGVHALAINALAPGEEIE